MSQQTAMKFFEAIRQNDAITEQLRALSDDVDAFARAAVEAGQKQGFVFETADVHAALAALSKQNDGELTDQDLSAVAGGAGPAQQLNTAVCAPGGYGGGSTACTTAKTMTFLGTGRITKGQMTDGC